MFPHYSQNSKKRKNHEIRSMAEIVEGEKAQEISKRTKTDFLKNKVKENSTTEVEQSEEQRRLLGLSSARKALGDATNKSSSDTSSKGIDGQGNKGEQVEGQSSDQTQEQKDKRREQDKENAQSLERQKLLLKKDRTASEVSPSLPENLKHISEVMKLQELDKLSMTDHAMETRGVDPEKFRRVSQELSNAMKNDNPDQSRISTTREEFRKMAEKLGLIRPEI